MYQPYARIRLATLSYSKLELKHLKIRRKTTNCKDFSEICSFVLFFCWCMPPVQTHVGGVLNVAEFSGLW